MPDCTRCGIETEREAIGTSIPVEHSENGVVWLCDSCLNEFDNWLDPSEMLL